MDTLRGKLDELLRRYQAMQKALASANARLSEKESELMLLKDELEASNTQLLALKIGHAIPDEAMRESSRRQLDQVIGEIDKILTTLHD